MTGQTLGDVLRRIGRQACLQSVLALSDAQLLERFADGRDEPAFAALMVRHGPMVLGVCRRLLPDAAQAEDAFQAAFLVLARKAGTIQRRPLLAAWLYGVAYKVAARVRGRAWRRCAHEKPGADFASVAARETPDPMPELHEEVQRLPDKYRSPVVLCYLEGKTHEEAALLLHWPIGTVKGRLARARDLLRSRLTRRGVSSSEEGVATALAVSPAMAPPALLDATIRAATRFAAGDGGAGGLVSARAVALTQGVLRTMILTKVKILTGAVLALAMVAGAGSYVRWGWVAGAEDAPKPGVRAADKPAAADKEKDDKDAIQGTWLATGLETAGKEAPDNDETKLIKSGKCVIGADKITTIVAGVEHTSSYKLDPTKKPKEIDVTPLDGPDKGKVFPEIYSLEGDVLKVCYPSPTNAPRPTEVATKAGSNSMLLTLKRQAPDKAKPKEDKPAADKDAIQGVWRITDFKFKGKAPQMPTDEQLKIIKSAKWVITADKIVVHTPVGKESKDDPASYKLDPSQTPKEIDITPLEGPSKGKTEEGIYNLGGGVLKLCMPGPEGGPRPTELAADKGGKNILLTLIREGVDTHDDK